MGEIVAANERRTRTLLRSHKQTHIFVVARGDDADMALRLSAYIDARRANAEDQLLLEADEGIHRANGHCRRQRRWDNLEKSDRASVSPPYEGRMSRIRDPND